MVEEPNSKKEGVSKKFFINLFAILGFLIIIGLTYQSGYKAGRLDMLSELYEEVTGEKLVP